MKSNRILRRVRELEHELRKHPTTCPKCGKEMSLGFLAGVWGHLFWLPKGKKMPNFLMNRRTKCLVFQYPMPSYLCETCRLAITQYKIPNDIEGLNKKAITNWNRASNECPYCGGIKTKGALIPTAGGETNAYLCWMEKIGGFLTRGKKVILTASFAYKGRLFTDKCRNCGLLFSMYDPQKIKKSNRIELIIWAVLFVVMIVLLFSILL